MGRRYFLMRRGRGLRGLRCRLEVGQEGACDWFHDLIYESIKPT